MTPQKYRDSRAEADRLKDQAMAYAKHIRGRAGKYLRHRIAMAWIANEQQELSNLLDEAKQQVRATESSLPVAD